MNIDFKKLKRKEVNYSGMMFFYQTEEPMRMILGEFTLRDKVDKKVLQQAVDRTLERMPYMGDTFVEEDGKFYYAENPLPMVVRETDKYPHTGGSETNFHMVDVICHDNVIDMSLFHALCDGAGFARFVETVLYYYFCIKDGVDYEPNGVLTHHTPMTEAEEFEPYLQPYDFDPAAVHPAPNPAKAFRLPERVEEPGESIKRVKISVPEKELVDYAKSIGSSPAVVLSMMFGEAIESVHPDHEDPITAWLMASPGAMLGCPETFKNCNGAIMLPLNSPELDKLSFEERAAQLRKIMKLQLEPDSIRAQTNMIMGGSHKIADMPGGYKDKKHIMLGGLSNQTIPATFMLDYMNFFHHNPYYDNIISFDGYVDTRGQLFNSTIGVPTPVVPFGGYIHIQLEYTDALSCYCNALADAFRKHGFEAIVSEPRELILPRSGWKEILTDD
jgi:hypothetical protein